MSHLPLGAQIIILFTFGICLGSFLNVCIDRWPKGESIIRPGSHCPYCKKPIPWYLNIPLLGWLFLRGKTACCSRPIPFRYFLSELGVGLGTVAIYLYSEPPIPYIPYLILFCLLWVAFFTDIDTMLIPDEISLLGITLGILLSYIFPQLQYLENRFTAMMYSIEAACVSMGGLFCFISFVEFFLKKEAMGLGDVKLIGCIGAFLGVEGCLFSLFFGAILGSTSIISFKIYKRIFFKKQISLRNQRIPFGPFLAIAAFIYMFFPLTLFAMIFDTLLMNL